MAKNVDLTSSKWCDIVFDGRNKDFGAYELRTQTKSRHLRAFIFTIVGFIILVALGIAWALGAAYIAEQQAIKDKQEQELAALNAQNEEEAEEPEEEDNKRVEEEKPEVLPEEVLNTQKATAIAIVEDSKVKEEIKTNDEKKDDDRAFGQTNFDQGTNDITVTREHKEEVVVEEKKPEPPKKEEIFKAVEQMPQFPGGDAALMKWLSSNIQYPAMAQENGVQGRVVVQFVVTKDGSIGEVKVVKSVDRDLDNEAKRLCKKLPKFVPGKNNGQPVNVWYTLPISFKLQGVN